MNVDPTALMQQITRYKNSGDFENAKATTEILLKRFPDHPDINQLYAGILRSAREFARSIQYYEKALKTKSDDADCWNDLAVAYQMTGDYTSAIERYKQALQIRPEFVAANFNLALVLNEIGDLKSALEYCNDALELKPDHYSALMLRGQINEHLGNINAAKAAYLDCIRTRPESTKAYWSLANLGNGQISRAVIETMQSVLQRPIVDDSKIFLLFALAAAMEQQKDYAKSFEYLDFANRLKHQQLSGSAVLATELVTALRNHFDADLLRRLSSLGNSQVSPIFIIGMVRSGTSLIEQILASHDEVASGGELETSLQLILDELPVLTGKDWPSSITELDASLLQRLENRYCEINASLVTDKPRFTDKLPFNFALVGFLASLFPAARFIHVYKHPLDSCLSCYKQLFTVGQEYSYSMDELAGFYQQYRLTMEHWSAVLPGKVLDVAYESVVDSPRDTIENMLRFLSLPWQEDCLQFHKRSGVVKTASAGQVRQGLYTSSVGRWKHYEQQLAPLAAKLGRYAP
jgi:tetratricopeptide (TPR) repeat protein